MVIFRNTRLKRWAILLACVFYVASPLARAYIVQEGQNNPAEQLAAIEDVKKRHCHAHSNPESATSADVEPSAECIKQCCKANCSGVQCHSSGAMALGDTVVRVSLNRSSLPEFFPRFHSVFRSLLFRPPILA